MGEKFDDSHGLEIIGEVLISVMMAIFFTVVLALFLTLCLRSLTYSSRQHDDETLTVRRRRRRLEFTPGHPAAAATTRRSLDPSVLNFIPVHTFSSKDFKDNMECAVCLSETMDGEKIRILPNCNHRFHVDCIDMWFQSNSTCPICRNSVSDQPKPNTKADNSAVFPTNVQASRNQGEVTNSNSNLEEPSFSASSSNVRPDDVVIEIPTRIDEDEETKSPVMKRLKSLKRLLSSGITRASPSSSTDPGKMGPDQC